MQFSCLKKSKSIFPKHKGLPGSGKKELHGAAFLLQGNLLLLGMMSKAWGERGRVVQVGGANLFSKRYSLLSQNSPPKVKGSLKDKRAYQKSRLDKWEPFFQQVKTALSEKVNSVMRRHQLRILVFPALPLYLQGDACLRAPRYLQFPPPELINYLFLFRLVVSWNFYLDMLARDLLLFHLKDVQRVMYTRDTSSL